MVAISSTPAQIDQPVTITVERNGAEPKRHGDIQSDRRVRRAAASSMARRHAGPASRNWAHVTITANYSGDSNILPGSATLKLQVGRAVAGLIPCVRSAEPGIRRERACKRARSWGRATPGRLVTGQGGKGGASADARMRSAPSRGAPARIVAYRQGRFARRHPGYPALVRRDAAHWWRLRHRGGALAPWAADEHSLGHRARVWRVRARRLRPRPAALAERARVPGHARGTPRPRYSGSPAKAAGPPARRDSTTRALPVIAAGQAIVARPRASSRALATRRQS